MKIFLIVGLGNPEKKFKYTRHNIGSLFINKFIYKKKIKLFFKNKYGLIYKLIYKNKILLLLISNLYINQIGLSIKFFLKKYKLKIKNLIILSDDIYLKYGKIKIKNNSGSGGHNGLKNIEKIFKTKKYKRIKIGISNNFEYGNQNKYVLSKINKIELKIFNKKIYYIIYNKLIFIINNNY
ncbi:MAG: aminoacyl-tRNA hydrolase [Candidatus Shikimatogenerans bostrichidophilus]|nr:MAG: aminoacyl-tRNA hydrolase [Candidatus Shikimatogenerans bostrichidophilus]